MMESMTRTAMIEEMIRGRDGIREPVGAIFDVRIRVTTKHASRWSRNSS